MNKMNSIPKKVTFQERPSSWIVWMLWVGNTGTIVLISNHYLLIILFKPSFVVEYLSELPVDK